MLILSWLDLKRRVDKINGKVNDNRTDIAVLKEKA